MNRVIVTICIVCVIVASVVGGAYYALHAQQAQTALVPVAVTYRHVLTEVTISGTTEAAAAVDLAFTATGIVDSVPVTVGQTVATDTVLMTLRSKTLKDRLAQAYANLDGQLAKLQDIKNGARPEQVAVTKAQNQGGETELASAGQGLLAALSSAESVTDVAVRLTIDQYIVNPTMSNASFNIPITDYNLSLELLALRQKIQSELTLWSTRIQSIQNAKATDLLAASGDMHAYLRDILSLLSGLTKMLAASGSPQFVPDTTAIATARATITSTNDALTAAEQSVQNAQAAARVTQQKLGLDTSGPTTAAADAQRAAVSNARAQVAELLDENKDQIIVAPFSGVITNVEAKQGETAVAGQTAVSMISNGQQKIEGYVPEIHLSEINIGQPVRIQLSAFPGESFLGTLGRIDPVAAPRNGVPNVKVTVYFANQDSRIKPGLTANAFIQTADKPRVLAVPIDAVIHQSNDTTVLKLSGTVAESVPVVLGSVSTDGYAEVVSGLSEGDTVMVDETKQYRIVPI